MAKPGNAIGVSVLNAPIGADAALATQIVTITGLPEIKYKDIDSFDVINFTAGVLQQEDVDFAGLVPTVGSPFKIVIRPNLQRIGVAEIPKGQSETYTVIASTTTLTDLIDQFVAAINTSSATVTATRNSDVMELNQDDFTIDGFSVPEFPAGITDVTTNTAFVAPNGSPSQVESFVDSSVTVAASGEFRRYTIVIHKRKEFAADGDVTSQKVVAIVFADELAGSFAAFNTAITNIVDGSEALADYVALT